MTAWSQGASDPSSAWDDCGAAPSSAWRPCGLSIDPASGEQGNTVAVTIRGDGFTVATTVAVSGAGVVVQNKVVVDSTTITADFVIAPTAIADSRVVTVTTGAVSETAGFSVEASWIAITDRMLWLEADANADLTIATGVTAWADHSGNGRAMVQAAGGRQPAVVAGAMNTHQAVRFDGIDDLLTLAVDFQLNAGSTIVIVANVRFAIDTVYRPCVRTEPSNAFGIQHEASNDPTSPSKLEAFVTAASGLKRATPTAATVAGIRCISVVVDPSADTISIYHDGVLVGGTNGVSGLTSTLADTLRLCADATGVNYGTYDIGTVRLYRRALTTVERQAVEADARRKWVP